MVALHRRSTGLTLGRFPLVGAPDEQAARRTLRRQITRLDRDLSDTLVAAFPRAVVNVQVESPSGGPRLLSLGELELLRDDLAEKLRRAREQVARRADFEAANRDLLERMLIEPGRYKFVRMPNRDIGETGCGVWHVRPRLGLIGMLAGWWHVKLSSGCPLLLARPPGRWNRRIRRSMGKRSRKRADPQRAAVARPRVAEPAAAPHARPVDRRARLAEAPPAPWSPFPLIEICILIGIILIVIGFAGGPARRGALLGFGFALVSLSAIEQSIREHFAGFRSHTTILSAVCALVAAVPLYFLTHLPQAVILVVAAVVFGVAVTTLRSAFARRAGGLGFRA